MPLPDLGVKTARKASSTPPYDFPCAQAHDCSEGGEMVRLEIAATLAKVVAMVIAFLWVLRAVCRAAMPLQARA